MSLLKEADFTSQGIGGKAELRFARHMKVLGCSFVVLNAPDWQYVHYEFTAVDIAKRLGCAYAPLEPWITYLKECNEYRV